MNTRFPSLVLTLILLAPSTEAGLLAHFSFDSDTSDLSGNSNHLVVAAGSPSISSTSGEYAVGTAALDLNSTTSTEAYLNLTNPINFAATDAWSVSFWARRRPGTDNRSGMVLGDAGNTTDFIWLSNNSSQVRGMRYRNSSNSNYDYGDYPDDNQFHHWVLVADGSGNLTVYRDNTNLGTTSATTTFKITSVGKAYSSTVQTMDGQIDELRIYDEALDSTAVSTLHADGPGGGTPDTTPPTLTPDDIIDDAGSGTTPVGSSVIYTVTFSEDMDDTSVGIDDFANAGTAPATIDSVNETAPGVFEIQVTPTATGTLQLQVPASATLTDTAGNPLDTSTAIHDDTIITVEPGTLPGEVKHIRVFLLGGQSNADGRADPSGLPTNPINLQAPQDDVDFYENEAGGLTTLRPLSQFGPEITWGRSLADSLANDSTRVAIIKYAVGGTSLAVDWAPGGDATTTGDGGRYISFQNVVTAGMAALTAAYPNASITIEGMLWVQGERDAKGGYAADYQTNLTNFIADVRTTYGNRLPFIICRLSSGQTNIPQTELNTVRNAQDAVAAADHLAGIINSDPFGLLGDNLHFNASGQQDIGWAASHQTLQFYPHLAPPNITQLPNGDFTITLSRAFVGFDYTLEFNNSLNEAGWSAIDNTSAVDNTIGFSITPTSGDERGFYRIIRGSAP